MKQFIVILVLAIVLAVSGVLVYRHGQREDYHVFSSQIFGRIDELNRRGKDKDYQITITKSLTSGTTDWGASR